MNCTGPNKGFYTADFQTSTPILSNVIQVNLKLMRSSIYACLQDSLIVKRCKDGRHPSDIQSYVINRLPQREPVIRSYFQLIHALIHDDLNQL